MAMISLAFGKYSARLFGILEDLHLWERILASSLIIGVSALNLIGSKLVSHAQRVIVIANLVLLAGFAVALSSHTQAAQLSVETWPPAFSILGSLALTFFAFTGFEVISNAAEDMENPTRDLPRAMYATIIFVIVLYVGLALAVVGAVSEEQLLTSGPALLAVAARSFFGEAGFIVLLISAVVASVTCLNGGLYGITSVTFRLAEQGQLPPRFKRKIGASTRGLTISAVLALLLTNFFSLTTVASLGSATSLLVYALVNFGALRLIKQPGIHRTLIWLSVAACSFAILLWAQHTYKTSPGSLLIFLSFLIMSFVAEGLLQRFLGRRIVSQNHDTNGTDSA
jgi:amino acid transporter